MGTFGLTISPRWTIIEFMGSLRGTFGLTISPRWTIIEFMGSLRETFRHLEGLDVNIT